MITAYEVGAFRTLFNGTTILGIEFTFGIGYFMWVPIRDGVEFEGIVGK